MDDMKHVIELPSKGQISIWTNNDLKHIYLGEPHQIQILSKVLDYIMVLKQNADGCTGLPQTNASASPYLNQHKTSCQSTS